MRESLPVSELWRLSQQGKLARVSEAQFNAYYAQQETGIGVWVDSAKLLPKSIPLYKLRQNWGSKWNPPQQLQQLSPEQLAAVGISH
jgi:predicted transcriptional regulator